MYAVLAAMKMVGVFLFYLTYSASAAIIDTSRARFDTEYLPNGPPNSDNTNTVWILNQTSLKSRENNDILSILKNAIRTGDNYESVSTQDLLRITCDSAMEIQIPKSVIELCNKIGLTVPIVTKSHGPDFTGRNEKRARLSIGGDLSSLASMLRAQARKYSGPSRAILFKKILNIG